MIDIPLEARSREDGVRAGPEFARLRHEIVGPLRDEFKLAEMLERGRLASAGAAA